VQNKVVEPFITVSAYKDVWRKLYFWSDLRKRIQSVLRRIVSLDISVSKATDHVLDDSGFYSRHVLLDGLWSPVTILTDGHEDIFLGGKADGACSCPQVFF
jgi:hypothetical protein